MIFKIIDTPNLQHELNVVTRTEWVDHKVTIPLSSQVSEDLLDDFLTKLLVLRLVVSVAEDLVARLEAKIAISLLQYVILALDGLFFRFFRLLVL